MWLLLGLGQTFAQINQNDPLSNVRHLISEDEVVLLWNETNSGGTVRKKAVSFYDFNAGGANMTAFANVENTTTSAGITGLGSADVASGFFFDQNIYDKQGLVQAWRGNSGGVPRVIVELSAPDNIYTGSAALRTVSLITQRSMAAAVNSFAPQVSVATGNFWGTRRDEFFVVYHTNEGNIAIELYEPGLTCATCTPTCTVKSAITGPAFTAGTGSPRKSAILDADAGDVDGDGFDELVIAYTDAANQLMVNVYDVNAAGTIILKTQQAIFNPTWRYSSIVLGVTVGDFNTAFAGEEIAVAARWGTNSGTGNVGDGDTRLYTARMSGTSLVFNATTPANFFLTSEFNQTDAIYGLSLASGDVNGDLTEEVVMAVGPKVFIFKVNETSTTPSLVVPADLGSFTHNLLVDNEEGPQSNDFLAVGNVDNLNGNFGYDFRGEIILAKNRIISDGATNNKQQSFVLNVFGFNNTPANPTQVNYSSPVLRNKIENQFSINNENELRRYALAVGDFNGGSVQLGNPTVTTLSDVLTPLVVINAPPTHFDVFGNKAFDLNNLYAVGEPAPPASSDHFKATYKVTTNTENTFETQFTSDWAVSGSVSAGFSAAGFNLGSKLTQTYGEQFSKTAGTASSITIVEQRSAKLDDELLAYTVDYTLYEYPVYNSASNTPITNLLVVIPGDLQKTFTAASSRTHRYPLRHQHGNLLSYPAREADLDLEDARQVYTGLSRQEISSKSSAASLFGITWTNATASGLSRTNTTKTEVSAEAGGSFSGFSLGASVSGSYATADVKTKTSNYQQSVELAGVFGKGENDPSAGDYSYFVKPITYWSKDGSLVLDYLVDIDNNPQLFWGSRYNKYDPAFLLPYQYELEKGFTPSFESERFQTRDIRIAPFPRPGISVNLKARVHNYGLQDTPNNIPVEVCFFYSDPAAGGAAVQIGCASIAQSIRGRINDFDAKTVQVPWTVPANLGPNTHIFAVIDRNNALGAEVHDYPISEGVSNNLGWTCLFNPNCTPPAANTLFPTTTSTRELVKDHAWRAWPNPTSGSVFLENTGEQNAEGRIDLLDMSGRTVKNWVLPAHSPFNRLSIDTQSPGMYLLRVTTERGVFVEKILKQ